MDTASYLKCLSVKPIEAKGINLWLWLMNILPDYVAFHGDIVSVSSM